MQPKITTFFKRTKIVATMGPAITQKLFTWSAWNDPKNAELVKKAYQRTEEIILAGVNCCRLNFSHGSYEEQEIRIKVIRETAAKLKRNIAIMLDTKGPEIRVNKFEPEFATIEADSKVQIYCKEQIVGSSTKFSVSDSTGTYNMAKDVKIGHNILIDDGKLDLVVESVDEENGIIHTVALNTHTINEGRRINLPNSTYTMKFLSDKDKNDIEFACKNDLDYIAASFVNNPNHVNEIRQIILKNNRPNIQIISKIETGEAIKNLCGIIDVSDGIMVARGDLALEIPYYDVPYWQKQIIRYCRYVGKPTIVATQMLDSLERNIQPTRAEVTDVFFAVERGSDANMLSGESAKGQFPVIAVKTMATIDERSELLFDYDRALKVYFPKTNFPRYAEKTAIKIAKKLMPTGTHDAPIFNYNYLALFTDDKMLVRAVSNIRPAATILLITSEKELLRSFAISYGVQSFYVEDLNAAKGNYRQVINEAMNIYPHEDKRVIAYIDKKFVNV